jgi:membrane protein YqaA with SNARE-associated domain
LGLLGVFVGSLIGHFSVVLKDIIFIPIFLYVSQYYNPLLMGLAGGIGGGLGEMGVYLMGRGVGKLNQELDAQQVPAWIRKLGLASVLLCSLTPIPDAPLLIFLGTARFSVLLVLLFEIAGKIILYTLMAIVGSTFISGVQGIIPPPWDSILLIGASLGFSILISWKKTRTPILNLIQRILRLDKMAESSENTS